MAASHLPDLNQLRLSAPAVSRLSVPRRGRRRWSCRFLRGPIQREWVNRAANLPGRGLHVAMAIRLWTGIKKTDWIVVPTGTLAEMGVSRHAARRAVRALERAGLVAVIRHTGRKTRVRVIEVDAAAAQAREARTRWTEEKVE